MHTQSHALISFPVRHTVQITTPTPITHQTQTRPLVLVIDTDPIFLQLIKQAFSTRYQVFVAHDLGEALKLLRRGCFQLLLVDLSMPLCDSIGLLERIRTQPRLQEVPLLAISTSRELRQRLADMEVLAVVPKARWLDDLAHALGETIRLAEA